jgi:hypothetical protein
LGKKLIQQEKVLVTGTEHGRLADKAGWLTRQVGLSIGWNSLSGTNTLAYYKI